MENHGRAENTATRAAAERGLAIVGFFALVAFGIWLAIYAARYVPSTVNRLGAAAVALSSLFVPAEPTLSVVPNATTTIPFGTGVPATSTPAVTPKPKPTPATPAQTTPGPKSSTSYPINGAGTPTTPATLSGLPDVASTIVAVGYLTSTSTDSFVASSTSPAGTRPAVKFSIKNIGTNVADSGWHFSASIPTQGGYVFYSPPQQALNPGDSIEYILGFDQATTGVGSSISIIANSDQFLHEQNTANNSASATITILR